MEPESQPGSSAHHSPSLLPPSFHPFQREDVNLLSLSSSLWTVFARWVMVMRGGGGLEGGVLVGGRGAKEEGAWAASGAVVSPSRSLKIIPIPP